MNDSTKKAAMVLRALNNPFRFKILDIIRTKGQVNVTELQVSTREAQPVVSQHLKILRDIGAVKTKRDGKYINYVVDDNRINKIFELSDKLVNDTSK